MKGGSPDLKFKRKPAHRVETLCRISVPDIVLLEQEVVGFQVNRKGFVEVVNGTKVEVVYVAHFYICKVEV